MRKQGTNLKNIRYYQLINVNVDYALYIGSNSDSFTKEKAYLSECNE